jgi:predicted phosphoadenosine phosphosulfate sulfurtransferase
VSRATQIVKTYREETVLEAARARMRLVFDRFEHVFASVSGGKDSGVLAALACAEARARGRKVGLFFLDQEAEYQATIDVVRIMMRGEAVTPLWYQVPIRMTNATSYEQDMLYAWGPGEEWMREKEPGSVHAIEADYPQRFYDFFDWWEGQQPSGSAFLVGLRAEEGINRFRAVTKNPGMPGVPWSTKMAFRALTDLAALEPETYAKLIRRLKGVHCAARHADAAYLYDARELPGAFPTWLVYRDHLLATLPVAAARRARFAKRFAGQGADERVYQAQCKQLLTGDHENNVPVTVKAKADRQDRFARWRTLF